MATPTQAQLNAAAKVQTAYVNTTSGGLVLRKTPGTQGALITTIPRGASVTRLGIDSGVTGWAAVMYGSQRGYVSSVYLSQTKPQSASPTATTTTKTSTTATTKNVGANTTTNDYLKATENMATEKLKKALKIGGIVAGVGLLAFGTYKVIQKKKAQDAARLTATRGKALNGLGTRRKKRAKTATAAKARTRKSVGTKTRTLRLY